MSATVTDPFTNHKLADELRLMVYPFALEAGA